MSIRDTLEPVLLRIPEVSRPDGHVPFKKKSLITIGVLLVYFTLTNITLFGLSQGGTDLYAQFRSVLAGSQGSILQLGIGPIVTASIVLQLLSGVDLLPLDIESDPRDQALYQSLQKWLVIVMVIVTGAPMVFSGTFLVADSELAQSLGIGTLGIQMVMFLQVFVGGLLIMYLDEVVTKWGIGQGIGLFIIAGIAQRLVGGLVTQVALSWWRFLGVNLIEGLGFSVGGTSIGVETWLFAQGGGLAVLSTLFILAVVVYSESVKIKIPISNSKHKGFGGQWPIKLIYASVMPLILVRAVQANFQFIGRFLAQQGVPGWVATYGSQGQAVGGFFYYLAPIQSPQQWMWWLGGTGQSVPNILIRLGVDGFVLIVGGAVAALFWVETTGMGAESVAEKMGRYEVQMPGFRQNTKLMARRVNRFIPYVTVLGGAIVGFLALIANMAGTIGGVTGTGLLLAVSITYRLYQTIGEEMAKDMNTRLQKVFSAD